ncbi:DNA methyltransferase [Treponema primitia]|uniref:DNA methyltransferase n=1 Tax=Treponema primitia TaxID=88058 RepID=UPI00030146A9|nr:DNA methyltransferase [Treponema primitia]
MTKTDIDKVRNIEGFPIAKDEDIIALSDPPYYTACPNPFIEDFIKEHGTPYNEATDTYHREPFAADVSEGKNDPIYNAHSYHTKVPHKAIMRYILHYTKPGDIVFDGFCGTGMTGVAAQMCGCPDEEFKQKIENEMPGIEWGARKAILNDLSPAATFIAYNYNTPVDVEEFRKEAEHILAECETECGWMYETIHVDKSGNPVMDLHGNPVKGRINYTVWSDVFICPTCSNEIVYWHVAIDADTEKVMATFDCPHCGSNLKKQDCNYSQETHYDIGLRTNVTISKQIPVRIHYTIGGKRYTKTPDEFDYALIEKISNEEIPFWYPTNRMCEGSESRRNDRYGITHIHQYYTKRNLWSLAVAVNKANNNRTLFILTAIMKTLTKMFRWAPHGKHTAGMSGTLYLPSVTHEYPIFGAIERRIALYKDLLNVAEKYSNDTLISCSDLANTFLPNDSIDYIFTDPPFGGNLNYSELSFIWETWLKVITNNKTEAIINTVHHKGLPEYQALMTHCFFEYYRVLKPGRWMTVEFHNSQNSVWNTIQEALQRTGFILADVRTLDKQQSSFKQVTTSSAVKQDLVISAYKPKNNFKKEFIAKAGSLETAWTFISQHLEQLPVAVIKDKKIELITERQAYLLFDRMVAYHIMNGISVPLDASDFYKGLDEKFLCRDTMYFLPNQVNEYDTARIKNEVEKPELELFVTNERTAIAWLYSQLETPQTYGEIQPKFMREGKTTDKYEAIPELMVMLEENFIQDDNGKWYVPDRTKEGDVVKLREKNLLKDFNSYLITPGKLKQFRTEAIRVGFARLWADKNYKLIVETAERLPESVIQEDDKLLMYYDISLGRV